MQNNTPPTAQQHDSDEIDLLALLGALIDGKWIIAGFTVCFAVIGVAYALLATPIYQANALIQIEEKSGNTLSGLGELSDMLGSTPEAVTEIELLKSRAVIGQAVDNLKLDIIVEPHYFPIIGRWMARRYEPDTKGEIASPLLGFDSFAWGGENVDIFQLDVPSSYLSKPLELVAGANNTYTLYNDDGELLLQGAVGEQVSSSGFTMQVKTLNARPETRFDVIKQRKLNTIIDYQQQLGAAERGKDSGIISLSMQHDNPQYAISILDEVSRLYVRQNVERNSAEAAQSLEFLREQLPQVRKELERYEQALNEYQTSTNSVDITIETQAILDQIVELDTLISEQNLKRAEMERRFTRQHPSYQALLDQMEQLKRQKAELTSKVESLPATQQELLRLTRDVAVTTEVYTTMLNSTQELDVLRAGTVGNVRVIDTADVNVEEPVKPKKALIAIIATLLGGFIGVALVLLRKALNRGVEDPDVIEQLGLPVYATIPFSRDQEVVDGGVKSRRPASATTSGLLAVTNPADLAIEALRSLRTSLHFARLEAKNNILMISGPSPGVGKSFVSANLGAIMAQAGQRVLLIDADMRKGYLNKLFKLPAENGLSELLATRITSKDAIYQTEVEGLQVVPRGQIPPNPSELLMHANFTSFLDNVKDEYDIVIVDTPPILAVTDAAIVGRHVGMSLIVTRFAVNAAKEIEVAMRRFEQNDIQLKGAIFNAVEKKASSYGYGNYGYYNYEYKSDK
ncbi:tyrosine-protein kinase [Pseudomonas abyssi]|uniref:Tyrosine-protein kinase n=1 Tax=Pseudomonas abyssi TaxID=170540 RepID=A0A2A3MJX7_9PSED|nr:polysaccharide biosynthesis tyrosine autokinase [Pseudomonas abyssi]MAD01321.1 tyrosine-protein kinase [Pseudomonadales bacterium]PBK04854.1 tyrosine-protein kinase [Pseudomonas abyssi]|tara:strand:- start:44862 stop:47087 length:2226 start_codon:yes stop_codon:yes gene_type:complete